VNASNQTDVMKNKMLRGQVLKTLTLFYPAPVDISNIKTALMTRGYIITADSMKVLHYLQDKGYIRMTENKIQDIDDSDLVELTAKGVDLIEDTIEDAGVVV